MHCAFHWIKVPVFSFASLILMVFGFQTHGLLANLACKKKIQYAAIPKLCSGKMG